MCILIRPSQIAAGVCGPHSLLPSFRASLSSACQHLQIREFRAHRRTQKLRGLRQHPRCDTQCVIDDSFCHRRFYFNWWSMSWRCLWARHASRRRSRPSGRSALRGPSWRGSSLISSPWPQARSSPWRKERSPSPHISARWGGNAAGWRTQPLSVLSSKHISALSSFISTFCVHPEGVWACRPSPPCFCARQTHQAESTQAPGSSAPCCHLCQRNSSIHLHRAEPGAPGQQAHSRGGLGALPEHPAIGQQRSGWNVLRQHLVQAFQHPDLCGKREGWRWVDIKSLLFPGELLHCVRATGVCFHLGRLD